jgi:hypothetical protein
MQKFVQMISKTSLFDNAPHGKIVNKLYPVLSNSNWLLVIIIFISIFFHFYRLDLLEFVGEDEALVMNKIVRLLHWRTDVRNLGSLLTAAHPPLRYLVSLPFVYFFGATEFWLRFPHALAGVLAVYWIYRISSLVFGHRSGLLAALVLSVSSISAAYRSANGIGVFTLFVLVALECLIRSEHSNTPGNITKWLSFTSLSLGLATITFLEGVVFVLPVVYFIYKRKLKWKIMVKPFVIYVFFAGGYLLIWNILPKILSILGFLPPVLGGNASHLIKRLSLLGDFNLIDTIGAIIVTNSLPMFLFFIGIGFIQKKYLWQKARIPILYFVPHVILWLFVFQNPCGHGAYVTPLLALLIGGGVSWLWTISNRQIGQLKLFTSVLFMGALILTGWQNYVLNLQSDIKPTLRSLIYFEESFMQEPCGAPRFTFVGKAAAGLFVRENGRPTEQVLTDIGGNMELFYAGLPHTSAKIQDLEQFLTDKDTMQTMGIHFLVVQNNKDYSFTQSRVPAAIVSVRGHRTLYIYDLWEDHTHPLVLEAEEMRNDFYEKFGFWTEIRPVVAVYKDRD